MSHRQYFSRLGAVLTVVLMICATSSAARPLVSGERADVPETVMVTLRAKPGAEAELARVIARHWETAKRLNMVIDAPRVTLQAKEAGDKTYFVEIFTWRDASLPDSAPAAIQEIWGEMNRLVEARGGRPGLEIVEMSPVIP